MLNQSIKGFSVNIPKTFGQIIGKITNSLSPAPPRIVTSLYRPSWGGAGEKAPNYSQRQTHGRT